MVDLAYNDALSAGVTLIIDRVAVQLGDAVGQIQGRIIGDIGELGDDPQLTELLQSSVTGNVETGLHVIRNGIAIDQVKPPAAALEYARRVAQQGLPLSALIRAYRLGQQELIDRILIEIRRSELDSELKLAVYESVSRTTFGYIDWISQQVADTYEVERERWLEHRNSVRAVRVREILDNDDQIDVDAATTALGYPLRGRHLALILWNDGTDTTAGNLLELERFTQLAAGTLKLSNAALFIAADRVSGSAWLPMDARTKAPIDVIRRLADRANTVRVAAGTVESGLVGFRRSHRRAQDARRVAVVSKPHSPVTVAGDPGIAMAALLAENITKTRRWVQDTLGPLASDTPNDARLRETLRVFLREGSSYTAAAEHLMLHHNSVRYRVSRALERRGEPIDGDRTDIELALLACEHFGQAVLKQ
jgi:DNA-binding PucR family transcriptional regulator